MDMTRWVMAACLLSCVSLVRAGDIYTCKGKGGVNVYQSTPCPKAVDELNHAAYDASMRRAADGSSGHTERGTNAPSMRKRDMVDNPPASTARIKYGGRDAGTSTQSQPSPLGGIGSSAFQRGEVGGTRYVSAKARAYYTAGRCGTSVTYAGDHEVDWRHNQVQGVPGAVMINPDQAIDPIDRAGGTTDPDGSSGTNLCANTRPGIASKCRRGVRRCPQGRCWALQQKSRRQSATALSVWSVALRPDAKWRNSVRPGGNEVLIV